MVKRSWLLILLSLLVSVTVVSGQSQEPSPKLVITDTNTESLPSVEMRLYAIDELGTSIDLSGNAVTIDHGGAPATPIVAGTDPVGTFTLFLVDFPAGLEDQLPAIEQAITQFASPPTMTEQLDSVAIYQVGEASAVPLMQPEGFYNSIINLFSTGIIPATGATALIDSTVALLDQIGGLKRDPAMYASIVLISDGTDIVSTQFQQDDLIQIAADLGIPIHTIWAQNPNISSGNQEQGKSNMLTIASGTRGVGVELDKTSDASLIWDRIASFRNQTRLRYTAESLSGGPATVTVSLSSNPAAQDQTTVTVPDNVPSVTLNIAPESRRITLPSVEDPVSLTLGGSVSWLDGVEREITAVQLKVNETFLDVPIDSIASFEVEIPDLIFGDNSFQLIVLDEQEIRAQSAPVVIVVDEGDEVIPAELQAGSSGVLATILLYLLLLGLLAGLAFFAWRNGWFNNLGSLIPRGRRASQPHVQIEDDPSLAPSSPVADPASAPEPSTFPHAIARLEIVESTTPMPVEFPLTAATVRIGRSPMQTDIAFEQDITVSRLHATLALEGNEYRIYDQGSTSGTWVNEQRVSEYGTQLVDGDDVHLGAVHLRYRQP
ncbi:MAG: FHA domain-containing protein [Chloroflexota bacterium]